MRGGRDEIRLPLTTVLLALIAFWYRRRGADERVAAARRLRQRGPDGLFDRRPRSAPRSTWSGRSCLRRIRSSPNSTSSSSRPRRPPSAASSFMAGITLEETLIGFRHRRGARRRLAGRDRLDARARTLADAVDRRLADGADHRARADDRRHPQPVRHRRHCAEGRDRRLSLVLSDHRRDGQGPALAGPVAARSHAHLFGDARRRPSRSCARPRARRSFSPA